MPLEAVKAAYVITAIGNEVSLKAKDAQYRPDANMLKHLMQLKRHKVNTLYSLKKEVNYHQVIAVDIETTAKRPEDGEIRLISVYSPELEIVTEEVEKVADLLANPKILKVFHNAAFDVTWLMAKKILVENYTDTMVMAQILHNTTHSNNSLQGVALEWLGIVLDKSLQSEENWTGNLTPQHKNYALQDAKITYELHQKLSRAINVKCLDAVLNREIRALPAIIMLNLNGLPFDYAEWKQILSQMEVELGTLENEIQSFLNQAELNLASPQQVLQSFASKGIQVPSTKEEDLAKYELEYPVIQKLCKYKKIKKRLTTYGEKLQRRISCDGKIRGEWRLIGTDTSRMSCKSPNLQGLPTQAKPYVKAPSGECFVIADYSTIELRILAEITHDQELITAFQKKQDLHEKTARAIFDKSEDAEITADERKIGKVVNFGLIYGMTAYGLQKKITSATGKEISYQQAQVFRNRYFGLYPGVLQYQDQMLKAERIFTLGGRYWSSETTALKSGAISRFNYPIQGTGAEGLKEALAILMQHLPPNWKLVAVVHDEIVLQVPENESTNAKQCLRIAMQKGMQQLIPSIPIEIDIKTSVHWAK